MTTPASLTNSEGDELVALARQIRVWQEAKNLSDNQLLRSYPGLGSTKTFTRLLKSDFAELDLQRWLSDYRAVWAVIEALAGREQEEEELYEDLSTVIALRRSLNDIFACRSIRRLILVEGDSGLGKTSALTFMQRKWGQRIIMIEATKVWGDNPNALLGAILTAFGVTDQAMSRDGRLGQVLANFRKSRTALAIDEAHHMGIDCTDTVKTLINVTGRTANPCEVILLTLPTLWRRLERAAYEEVRQLLGNRLAERIKLGELRESDVKKMLQRRVKAEDLRSAAAVLREAKTRGNLSFVAAVCERIAAQELDGAPTHEVVLAAIAAEIARR